MEPNRLPDESIPSELRDSGPRPDAVLNDGFGALEPGEIVTVVLRDRSLGSASGQVLAADDDRITIFEPAEGRFGSGSAEEIPTAGIASVTRRGSAPLPVTMAVPTNAGESSGRYSLAIERGRTPARLERAAGLILLGFAVLTIVGAVNSLVDASSRRAENGEAELVALGQLGAVVGGIVGLLFLIAAVGVLRSTTWGRGFGLVLSSLSGVLLSVAVLSSPAPWDHSAGLGDYQASAAEWLFSFVPAVACWVAVVALIRARGVREHT